MKDILTVLSGTIVAYLACIGASEVISEFASAWQVFTGAILVVSIAVFGVNVIELKLEKCK